MEITGKIIQCLPEQGGTSKAGNAWRKREYVLETQGSFPRKVCFNMFGERIDQYPVNMGDDVTVSFDLESREFNGRWYTDVRAYKIEKASAASSQQVPPPPAPGAGLPTPGAFPPAPADLTPAPGATDDLPF